ncbi:MAG: helix-turn-helix transcriptional regulator [Promethearchaeia archaeon]
MKFKKKLVSNVRELREEKELTQSELGDLVGVSRQTIYYLEKGNYNPKLTLSLQLSKVLETPIGEIFHFEPIIKDIISHLTVAELEDISRSTNLDADEIMSLRNISDEELDKKYEKADLKNLTDALEKDFNELFEVDQN